MFQSASAILPALEQTSGGVKFNVVPGATTIARANLLKEGTTRVMWGTALDAYNAMGGIEDFAAQGPQSWRALYVAGGLDQGAATRADSGIKTWQDIRGRKVATYPAYPIVQAYIDAAMAFGGISWNDVIKVPISSYTAGQTALLEGAVDVAIVSGETADARNIEASVHGLRWLQMPTSDVEGWKRFNAIIPVYYPNRTTVSAGSSPSNPIDIWAYSVQIITYDSEDPNFTYWFTKLLVDGYGIYKDSHSFNAKWTLEHALDYTSWFVPWHEGSIKYLKDTGKWTPQMEAKQQELLKKYPQKMTK